MYLCIHVHTHTFKRHMYCAGLRIKMFAHACMHAEAQAHACNTSCSVQISISRCWRAHMRMCTHRHKQDVSQSTYSLPRISDGQAFSQSTVHVAFAKAFLFSVRIAFLVAFPCCGDHRSVFRLSFPFSARRLSCISPLLRCSWQCFQAFLSFQCAWPIVFKLSISLSSPHRIFHELSFVSFCNACRVPVRSAQPAFFFSVRRWSVEKGTISARVRRTAMLGVYRYSDNTSARARRTAMLSVCRDTGSTKTCLMQEVLDAEESGISARRCPLQKILLSRF